MSESVRTAFAIYRVKVIQRLAPGKRKHSAGDYLVLASSPGEAQEKVALHLGEWIAPIHVSKGVELGGAPIPFTHYSLDPSDVASQRSLPEAKGTTP